MLKHKSVESTYWNQQGIEYILGKNKEFSIDDSVRCFKKSMDLGDDIAVYNLAILSSLGFIEGSLNSNPQIQRIISNLPQECHSSDDNSNPINESALGDTEENIIDSSEPNIKEKSKLEVIEENLRSTSIADAAGLEVIIATGIAGQLRK